mmetsp:Transcript_49631/g.105640  ORF Transcript_49631/g.105640 Transcript_49631/m.105640 type:complete len:496 (-) Transcript_49631:345-1832(-)
MAGLGYEIRPSQGRGYGIFARAPHSAGSLIFNDQPLFVMQHTGSRRVVAGCANCCAFIGSLRKQLEVIFSEASFSPLLGEIAGMIQDWETSILGSPEAAAAAVGVCCQQGCGERYCSEACREAHWRHSHNLLCTGPITQEEHPLIQFKYHALEHSDTLLLAAQVCCHLVNKAKANGGGTEVMKGLMQELLCFCHAPFRDACRPPPGRAKDAEFYAHTDGLINRGAELLANALKLQAPDETAALFEQGPAFLSEVLGMFEYNNIDVEVPSPLGRLFMERATALHSAAQGGGPDAARAAVELSLMEKLLREKEWVMKCVWGEETTGNYAPDMLDNQESSMSTSSTSVPMANNNTNEMGINDEALANMETDATGFNADVAQRAMSEARRAVASMSFEQLLQAPWPSLHGIALFTTVARCNHSCAPNAKIEFPSNSAQLSAVALTDIAPGSEFTISYIRTDTNVKERKNQLLEYGFVCNCERCIQEDSGAIRKANKRLK